MSKSPRDTHGPVVQTGPTAGQNRSRNSNGQWRAKRSDAGTSRNNTNEIEFDQAEAEATLAFLILGAIGVIALIIFIFYVGPAEFFGTIFETIIVSCLIVGSIFLVKKFLWSKPGSIIGFTLGKLIFVPVLIAAFLIAEYISGQLGIYFFVTFMSARLIGENDID